ncbi:MAG TPA: hypothetical protein VGA96_07170, partial [Fibrella sp.]
EPGFDASLVALEQQCPQGNAVKLVMDRTQFITRSAVFYRYRMLTYWVDSKLVSVSACAETEMEINGKRERAIFFYDGRTHPHYRNHGLQSSLARRLFTEFNQIYGLDRSVLTLKTNNLAMLWMGRKNVGRSTTTYKFTYLTVPTSQRITLPTDDRLEKPPLFSTDLLTGRDELQNFYTLYAGTLGVWRLDQVYQLRVVHLAGWLRLAKQLISGAAGRKLGIPDKDQVLPMRLLMGFQPQYAAEINPLLADLAQQGIEYLLVATHPEDGLYRWLKPYAIDTTSYTLLADFPLQRQDKLTLDVRCL